MPESSDVQADAQDANYQSWFSFDSYQTNGSQAVFNFSTTSPDGTVYHLTEKLDFPALLDARNPLVTKLLDALHIALGVSYYKTFVPAQFKLQQKLTQAQANFWNSVYLNGLAEFFYKNQLDHHKLAKFEPSSDAEPANVEAMDLSGALLAIGGGKDSIVAGELLKKLKVDFKGFTLASGEHLGQAKDVAQTMDVELLGVARELDPQIHELNKHPDAHNGHVPISLFFALTGLLLCVLTGRKYLVVGNEVSASIPNTEWNGLIINHQWSKSFELELALQEYIHQNVSPQLWYFSAIRPASSIAVAKIFSHYPQYLDVFTSCNRVFVIDPQQRPNGHWCGQCAKCLSSYIILAPWVDPQKLNEAMGKNMLADDQLQTLFKELTGLEGHKPLDCVGTTEEINLSLNLLNKSGQFIGQPLMQTAMASDIIKQEDSLPELDHWLTVFEQKSFPSELSDQLITAIKESLQ